MEYPVAVISDIHANIEALAAVFDDIDQRGVKNIISLGDNIGYGPNPKECLDMLLARVNWSLMGNHDFGVLYEPTNFNAGAEAAVFWTRRQLEDEPSDARREQWWNFFGKIRTREDFDRFICVHASPRRPINEYIFPDDVSASPTKMQAIFDVIPDICLVGHTHVQGVFTNEPDFFHPEELNFVFQFVDGEKAIINVGSVGQPRDRDPRAAYAILHQDRIEFVRVEYDVQTTSKKVEQTEALPDFFAQRLLEGR